MSHTALIQPFLKRNILGLTDLVFPRFCLCCSKSLTEQEKHLCLDCTSDLPKTNYHLTRANPAYQTFKGRSPFYAATSQFIFKPQEKVQELLHQIKYHNAQKLAYFLGKSYGKELSNSEYKRVQVLLPIPLHKKKLRKRGYNQAAAYAKGISASLGVPVVEDAVCRTLYQSSQTKLNRFARWQNIMHSFECINKNKIKGQHLALVDDVLTTGATLEAAAKPLFAAGIASLSIITLAHAP